MNNFLTYITFVGFCIEKVFLTRLAKEYNYRYLHKNLKSTILFFKFVIIIDLVLVTYYIILILLLL